MGCERAIQVGSLMSLSGILAFQITNRYMDSKPALYRMSVEFKKTVFRIAQYKDDDQGLKRAEHVRLTGNDFSTLAPLLKE